MKIIINTSNYDQKSGGIIVLHYMCHLLNELGYESYLIRAPENQIFDLEKPILSIIKICREYLRKIVPLKTNSLFKTPVLNRYSRNQDDIVIYGEQVIGNPLKANNVIRYLLHTPGYHTGIAYYDFNEYHIAWDNSIKKLNFPAFKRQSGKLKIAYYLNEFYNKEELPKKRNGSCYMVRKGQGKKFIHPKNSVCLDNMSHSEISKVFKASEIFYSYDTLTMYSRYAVMCGCISVVVPDEGVSEDDWNSNSSTKHGIAYGPENIPKAKQEMGHIEKIIQEEIEEMKKDLVDSVNGSIKYFQKEKFKYFRTR